jgi:hypothetical protein
MFNQIVAHTDIMSIISKHLYKKDIQNIKEIDIDINPVIKGGIDNMYVPYIEPPKGDIITFYNDRTVIIQDDIVVINSDKYMVKYMFKDGVLHGFGALTFIGDFNMMVINFDNGMLVKDKPCCITAYTTYLHCIIGTRVIVKDQDNDNIETAFSADFHNPDINMYEKIKEISSQPITNTDKYIKKHNTSVMNKYLNAFISLYKTPATGKLNIFT